jgi:phosphate-selective porin OprO/OprP
LTLNFLSMTAIVWGEDQPTVNYPGDVATLDAAPQPVAGVDLPAAKDDANADLAKRVAELEKRLAELSKSNATDGSGAPAKPLIMPTGRIQFDATDFNQDANSNAQFGNVKNAVGFRRARIALLGGYNTVDYIIEMDFTGRGADSLFGSTNTKPQQTAFKDVYVQMHDLPLLGNVRVGHFKECFGLEQLTSDNYTTFMERSVCDEGTFVPGRNDGIMAFDWTENERATWAIGAFTNQTGIDQPPLFQYDHWGVDVTSRVTFLPWYDEPSDGRGLLHTGFSYAYRGAADDIASFAIRPENNFGPSIVSLTNTTAAGTTTPLLTQSLAGVNHWQVFDLESAFVYGPLSLQSELFAAAVPFSEITGRPKNSTSDFYGMYAYVSYFLTGENRPYNRKMGVFDRVRPYEDFFRVRTDDGNVNTGMGAWEIGYRFSYIDMLGGPANPSGPYNPGGGQAIDNTVGLNWYLNPYTRIMFNYIHSQDTYNVTAVKRVADGNIDMFMMRCAMDF